MNRPALSIPSVVEMAARLADEVGIESVTVGAVAQRLGVKPPALYKHVTSIGDLRRRIATGAMVDLGDALRDALQGRAGRDALEAVFATVHTYVTTHPGRYAATTGEPLDADDDLRAAAARVVGSLHAALSAYGIPADQVDHAIRMLRCTIHGYASLSAADGFQWDNDPDATVAWMVAFFDAGFGAVGVTTVGNGAGAAPIG